MQVIEFLNTHPIADLTNIRKAYIADKNVWILNYEHVLQDKNGLGKYDAVLCQCRNLVVREESPNNWRIMSQSFKRFFNWTEDVVETKLFTEEMLKGNVLASEKFDGSLITITYFDGKWHIFTRGSDADTNPFRGMALMSETDTSETKDSPPDSSKKENPKEKDQKVMDTFGARVRQFIDVETLDVDITYIFELCTPLANITKYSEPFIALLAANRKGVELDHVALQALHDTLPDHVHMPEVLHPKSIDDLHAVLATKAPDFEGYVLSYVDQANVTHRMKLKTPTYVSMHHAKSKQLNTTDVLRIIAIGETDEFLAYMPEYTKVFESIKKWLCNTSTGIDEFIETHKSKSRKDFAIQVGSRQHKWLYFDLYQSKYPNALSGFLHPDNHSKTAAQYSS